MEHQTARFWPVTSAAPRHVSPSLKSEAPISGCGLMNDLAATAWRIDGHTHVFVSEGDHSDFAPCHQLAAAMRTGALCDGDQNNVHGRGLHRQWYCAKNPQQAQGQLFHRVLLRQGPCIQTLLESIPVRVIVNDRAPLLGLAHYATRDVKISV